MMTDHVRTFEKDSDQYRRLHLVAALLTLRTNVPCTVADSLFDIGQDWHWTTILATNPDGSTIQLLSPADQKAIVLGTQDEMEKTTDILTEKLRSRQRQNDDFETKYQLVQEISKILSRVTSMRRWKLVYGAVNRGKFNELDRPIQDGDGTEAVCLIHENGTQKLQSIHADSMAAVVYDIGRLVGETLF